MENGHHPSDASDSAGAKAAIGVLWILSLVIVGFIGYSFGQRGKTSPQITSTNVLGSDITQPPVVASPTPNDIPISTPPCAKSGYAQKWEFLRTYVIKEGDSLPTIAENEMHDRNRVNEILKINGVGPLVVGATLYLPPENITKSSGNLKQVSGKLTEKNASIWHLNFNENEKGMGILIPGYWFEKVAGTDSYVVGDCLTVLLDDGNTVYSVSRQ
jgi:hypothetical protein